MFTKIWVSLPLYIKILIVNLGDKNRELLLYIFYPKIFIYKDRVKNKAWFGGDDDGRGKFHLPYHRFGKRNNNMYG